MLHQLTDFQRFTFAGITPERQCPLNAFVYANTAAHAGGLVHGGSVPYQCECPKLAKLGAVTTADAQFIIYLGDITGGCQHWGAIALGLHRAAAA